MGVLAHEALLYGGPDEFVAGVSAYVREGLRGGEPVVVVVPEPRLSDVRDAIGDAGDQVEYLDMMRLGANPARIIPAIRDRLDAQGGGPLRYVGEPVWHGQRACEHVEGERHEALINLAFRGMPMSILCPYDAARLDDKVLEGAQRTHPYVRRGAERRPSVMYGDPATVASALRHPLEPPPPGAAELAITSDLWALRRFVATRAAAAGLGGGRLDDLLLAANEGAANTLLHGAAPGVLRLWDADEEVVCEINDRGRIEDPLVGRRTPDITSAGGRGLWLINQLCDLVQMRCGPAGLTLRLHMRLDPAR
jgi:anti-sigma regulatory factor (Ser/Thr protein kinase)